MMMALVMDSQVVSGLWDEKLNVCMRRILVTVTLKI